MYSYQHTPYYYFDKGKVRRINPRPLRFFWSILMSVSGHAIVIAAYIVSGM